MAGGAGGGLELMMNERVFGGEHPCRHGTNDSPLLEKRYHPDFINGARRRTVASGQFRRWLDR
jgi:hypothetical protein